jgi:hypothetical protein
MKVRGLYPFGQIWINVSCDPEGFSFSSFHMRPLFIVPILVSEYFLQITKWTGTLPDRNIYGSNVSYELGSIRILF